MSDSLQAPLLDALAAATRWLDSTGTPNVVIGGVAASLLSRPRFTRDVDALALIPLSRLPEVLAAAAEFQLVTRMDDAMEFAMRAHVLLLRHVPTQIDIDVLLGALPLEREMVERAVVTQVGGTSIRLPMVEDLLIMKAIAHRPRDLDDIEALLAANARPDLERVRRWVGEFSRAAAMPDLLTDLEKVISRASSRDAADDDFSL